MPYFHSLILSITSAVKWYFMVCQNQRHRVIRLEAVGTNKHWKLICHAGIHKNAIVNLKIILWYQYMNKNSEKKRLSSHVCYDQYITILLASQHIVWKRISQYSNVLSVRKRIGHRVISCLQHVVETYKNTSKAQLLLFGMAIPSDMCHYCRIYMIVTFLFASKQFGMEFDKTMWL